VNRFQTKVACTALVALVMCFASSASRAEYRLQIGDTVEMVVSGVPELHQRSAVGLDGNASFPLVGQQRVEGLTVGELRTRLLTELSSKVFQQRTADGREVAHVVLPEEIGITIAEYRPLYLEGDVARPGELPFRPGITVRQAIAMAGGYDITRFRMNNPVLEAADMRAEYENLWMDFAREQGHLWRVRSELGLPPGPDPANLQVPVGTEFLRQLSQTESDHLKARVADLAKEKASLLDAINRSTNQLNVLAEKKKKDEDGNAADQADYDRVREMSQRGMASNIRISESRRAALMSSTQLLQTVVEISNIERQRHDYGMALERLDNQRKIELVQQMQEGAVRVAQLTTRLRAVGEKLLYSSALQSQLVGSSNAAPDITITRRGETVAGPTLNSELLPGDTLSVALRVGLPQMKLSQTQSAHPGL
jgi:polysaccharide export outer membrane protein